MTRWRGPHSPSALPQINVILYDTSDLKITITKLKNNFIGLKSMLGLGSTEKPNLDASELPTSDREKIKQDLMQSGMVSEHDTVTYRREPDGSLSAKIQYNNLVKK